MFGDFGWIHATRDMWLRLPERVVRLLLALAVAALGLAEPKFENGWFRLHRNPNILIADIQEDARGFLWLAASDGLYRFDGLHYQKLTGFPHRSANIVRTTQDGAVWTATDEGLVHYRSGVFRVVISGEPVRGLAATDTAVFALGDRSLRVGLDLSLTQVGNGIRQGKFLSNGPGSLRWFADSTAVCSIDLNHPATSRRCENTGRTFGRAIPTRDGGIWLSSSTYAAHWKNGKVARELRTSAAVPGTMLQSALWEGRNGRIWLAGSGVKSVNSDDQLSQPDEETSTATAVYESADRVWVAYARKGLAEYHAGSTWRRWREGLELPSRIAQLMWDETSNSVVAACNGGFYEFASGRWTPIRQPATIAGAARDGSAWVVSLRNTGLARYSGNQIKLLPDPLRDPDGYREILRDAKGRFWAASKSGLVSFESGQNPVAEKLPGHSGDAVDLEFDASGRLWVGYVGGLAWLDENRQWQHLETKDPVTFLRSFAWGPNEIWVARRRPGYFQRLTRNGSQWVSRAFAATHGFGPEDTHFLKRDSRGWIWRGSTEGVHVSDGRRVAPEDWIHVPAGRGLGFSLTGQYGFLEDSTGAVWISGFGGVTRVVPEADWFDGGKSSTAPLITRLEADGHETLDPGPARLQLARDTRYLRIEVGSFHTARFRFAPFRYRMGPGETEWKLSRDGVLEFRDLRRGEYSLEVEHAVRGESPRLTVEFRVGKPPGPGWPYPVSALAIMGMWALSKRTRRYAVATYWARKRLFLMWKRLALREDSTESGQEARAGEVLFGRFRLTRLRARGGFSTVFDAEDLKRGSCPVVVKLLHPDAGDAGWARNRFAHEVAALHSLNHPGIVRILDSWVDVSGEPGLAMQLVDGPTLAELSKAGRLPVARVARLMHQIGDALAAVHAKGLVHRDVKPDNIVLQFAGMQAEQAVLVDFGNTGSRGPGAELAMTKSITGSFQYMAPEQLTFRYSAASDVYSLAVMTLELITGKLPADLPAGNTESGFRAAVTDALSLGVGESAGEQLSALLVPALDWNPALRPGSVGDWSARVAAVLREAPGTSQAGAARR